MSESAVASSPAAAPLLRIEGIEVAYHHAIVALHGVSLDVRAGEIHALLGANGAGKSTTLQAVSHLLPAQRGQVRRGAIHYDGQDVSTLGPAALVRRGLVPVPVEKVWDCVAMQYLQPSRNIRKSLGQLWLDFVDTRPSNPLG